MTVSPLVDVAWLKAHLQNANVAIVDTRWYLMNPSQGAAEYADSHISGAIHLAIDEDLSSPAWDGPGRHPLPPAAKFIATIGNAGIDTDTHVVIYDSAGGSIATRLWWLLRYYGHTRVSLLDGGWQAWQAANGTLRGGQESRPARQFIAHPQPHLMIDADAVEALRHDSTALILDARALERYTGDVEPFGPRAGHIPSAISAPFGENLHPDGTLKPAEELKQRFDDLGVPQATQVVCYCGSGVTATHNIFAMHIAGYEAKLYPGSWSDWSNNLDRPIATGEQP